MRSQYARRQVLALSAMAVCSACVSLALADVSATKTLDWTFNARPPALGGNYPQFQAKDKYNVWAWARCGHGSVPAAPDTGSHTWQVINGHNCQHLDASNAVDASSSASKDISAAVPAQGPAIGGGAFRFTMTATLNGKAASAVNPCPISTASADSLANGWVWMPTCGTLTRAQEQYQITDGGVVVRGTWNGTGKGARASGGSCHDPVNIELININTGEVISQEIFHVDMQGSGDEAGYDWSWDQSGVHLSTPLNASGQASGNVSINGGYGGSWVTTPASGFGATLSNGVFSASGAWASLPWSFAYDQGVLVGASLTDPAASSNISLDYHIPPELMNEQDTYIAALSASDEEADAASVPEPTTLAMSALAGLTLMRRRH